MNRVFTAFLLFSEYTIIIILFKLISLLPKVKMNQSVLRWHVPFSMVVENVELVHGNNNTEIRQRNGKRRKAEKSEHGTK